MKHLLLTASAIASLAIPALSYAQDNQNRRDARQEKAHDRANAIADRQADRGVNGRWDRNNRTWWRGRADFRGFNGRRPGFWFRPGVGYFRPDPRWVGYSWRVGGRVPPAFRGYVVADPLFYGLRPAPYGYSYIYLDNNIVLMSVTTGLITPVLSDVY